MSGTDSQETIQLISWHWKRLGSASISFLSLYIYKTLPKCFLYYGYCIKNVFTACPLLPEVHCEVVWVNFTLCFCRLEIVCFLIIFCTNTFNNTLIVTSITKFKGCCLLLWVIQRFNGAISRMFLYFVLTISCFLIIYCTGTIDIILSKQKTFHVAFSLRPFFVIFSPISDIFLHVCQNF